MKDTWEDLYLYYLAVYKDVCNNKDAVMEMLAVKIIATKNA
jgi:hypothetical protein